MSKQYSGPKQAYREKLLDVRSLTKLSERSPTLLTISLRSHILYVPQQVTCSF